VVCDLDGVVYRGSHAIPHAVPALRAAGEVARVVYATNNASRTPAEVAGHLTRLGLDASAADVRTSAQAGAAELARRLPAGARVLAVGGPGVADALRSVGLTATTDGEVAGVLQGWGAQVRVADLAAAAIAVQRGAVWVATNRDLTLPTEAGIVPGNGTLVAAVATATGRDPIVVGKPHPPLYLEVAEHLGLEPPRLLAVGDRLDTDILGAQAAGMDSAWVLTGVDGFASLARSTATPTYAVPDLRGLLTPPVSIARTGWSWGDGTRWVRVRMAGGSVEDVAMQGFSDPREPSQRSVLVAVCARMVAELRSTGEIAPSALVELGRRLDRVARDTSTVPDPQ